MREIKFRIYDSGVGMIKFEFNDIENGSIEVCGYAQPLKDVMQYTGLKDKNGKEIYEGDIVRWYFDVEHGFMEKKPKDKKLAEISEQLDDIRFEEGGFVAWCDSVTNFKWLRDCHWACEVIGNIYENKELLNETQS